MTESRTGNKELVTRVRASRTCAELVLDPLPKNWNKEAEELLEAQPEIYVGIVEAIASGDSPSKVATSSDVSLKAVRAIRDRHPEAIEGYRSAVIQNMQEGMHLATEKIIEKMDQIPPSKIGITLDILTKNLALVTGNATSRQEHVTVIRPEDLQKMYEALPSANPE